MDKLLGKKRHEERERESNGAGGSGSRVGGSGSPRKKRSRSNSPGGGGSGPVLTRLERRAFKTDPNARSAWATTLVGERGHRSDSPSSYPKHPSGIRTKQSSGRRTRMNMGSHQTIAKGDRVCNGLSRGEATTRASSRKMEVISQWRWFLFSRGVDGSTTSQT